MRTGTLRPQGDGLSQVGLAVLPGDPRLSPVVTAASGFPSRHRKNNEKAQEASLLLKDNLELQNFLQNCQEVRPTEAGCSAGEPFLGAKSPESTGILSHSVWGSLGELGT